MDVREEIEERVQAFERPVKIGDEEDQTSCRLAMYSGGFGVPQSLRRFRLCRSMDAGERADTPLALPRARTNRRAPWAVKRDHL